jgi:hypothetical protein
LFTHARVSDLAGAVKEMFQGLCGEGVFNLLFYVRVHMAEGLGHEVLSIVVDHLAEGSDGIGGVELRVLKLILRGEFEGWFAEVAFLFLRGLFRGALFIAEVCNHVFPHECLLFEFFLEINLLIEPELSFGLSHQRHCSAELLRFGSDVFPDYGVEGWDVNGVVFDGAIEDGLIQILSDGIEGVLYFHLVLDFISVYFVQHHLLDQVVNNLFLLFR